MPLIDAVTALLRDIAAEEVLPRFGRLAPEEITQKNNPLDATDLVTVVDHAVERRLTEALPHLLPGSRILGEEAAAANPDWARGLAEAAHVWIVDPIDGTRNFAAGHPGFGIMVALVAGGETRVAWIVLPVSGRVFVAERGAGATVDGLRLRVPAPADPTRPRGAMHGKYMPPDLRSRLQQPLTSRAVLLPSSGASAIEYTELATGAREFSVYYRLLPWDHAPGVLLLTEAGGAARMMDGTSYQPFTPRPPLLLGASAAVLDHLDLRA